MPERSSWPLAHLSVLKEMAHMGEMAPVVEREARWQASTRKKAVSGLSSAVNRLAALIEASALSGKAVA